MDSKEERLEAQREERSRRQAEERGEREDAEELRRLFRSCAEETAALINREPFDRNVVADNIAQMREAFNDVAYCLTAFHLRAFKDLIRGLEEQLRRRVDIDRQRHKSSFSFQSRFRFVAIRSRPDEPPVATSAPADAPAPEDPSAGVPETAGLTGTRVELSEAQVGDTYRLRDLQGCEVVVRGRLKTLYLDGLRDCTVVAGVVEGALFADRLEGGRVAAVAQQVRVHNASDTAFRVFVASSMVVEDCRGLTVGPLGPERLATDFPAFASSKFAGTENQWRAVKDFNWLRDGPSPHFALAE